MSEYLKQYKTNKNEFTFSRFTTAEVQSCQLNSQRGQYTFNAWGRMHSSVLFHRSDPVDGRTPAGVRYIKLC